MERAKMTIIEKAALAERTARAAGDMLEHHGAFEVRRKAENDFVTEMDLKSERLIREALPVFRISHYINLGIKNKEERERPCNNGLFSFEKNLTKAFE